MKKLATVAVSIGVILVIVGLVLVGIYGRDKISSGDWFSFAMTNLNSANGGVDKQPNELEGLREINVNSSAYSVYVLKSETDITSVKYVEPLEEGVNINVEYNDGVLSVTQTDNLSNHWGFGWFKNHRFIAVYLPQTELLTQAKLNIQANYSTVKITNISISSADVTTDAGSITVEDLTADSITAKTSAGSIKVEDINSQHISLTSNAGSIKAGDVECADFKAESNAGSVKVNVKATASVDINVSAGSVKCEADTQKLAIKSSAGSIKFETNASSIDLCSDAGSIKGTIEGLKTEYQISVKKDMGSSNIENQTVQGATKFLNVEVDMGSIKINFDND